MSGLTYRSQTSKTEDKTLNSAHLTRVAPVLAYIKGTVPAPKRSSNLLKTTAENIRYAS